MEDGVVRGGKRKREREREYGFIGSAVKLVGPLSVHFDLRSQQV